MIPTIELEIKKDGLQQRQDGSWTVKLTANGEDMANKGQALLQAPMGQRYLAVLVELADDDEEAAHRKAESAVRYCTAVGEQEKERHQPSRFEKSRKLCGITDFQVFMGTCMTKDFWEVPRSDHSYELTSEMVKWYCGVKSKGELDTNKTAAELWDSLLYQFHSSVGLVPEKRG